MDGDSSKSERKLIQEVVLWTAIGVVGLVAVALMVSGDRSWLGWLLVGGLGLMWIGRRFHRADSAGADRAIPAAHDRVTTRTSGLGANDRPLDILLRTGYDGGGLPDPIARSKHRG